MKVSRQGNTAIIRISNDDYVTLGSYTLLGSILECFGSEDIAEVEFVELVFLQSSTYKEIITSQHSHDCLVEDVLAMQRKGWKVRVLTNTE